MGEQFDTIHTGHFDIGENQIKFLISENLKGLHTITGQVYLKSFGLQDFPEAIADGGLIINNKNSHMLCLIYYTMLLFCKFLYKNPKT
jgi:hypothetical protein